MTGPKWRDSPSLAGAILALAAATASYGGTVRGTVTDPAGRPAAAVAVELRAGTATWSAVTDGTGQFHFDELPPGRYDATCATTGAACRGMAVEVDADQPVTLPLVLDPTAARAAVTVAASTADSGPVPQPRTIVEGGSLPLLPLQSARFAEALPLLPGVIRGPDGKLNFSGARASQSTLLVNGSTATDPLTGDFAIELPIEAVESVTVYSVPYAAEYGSITAAVADVRTRGGGDTWKLKLDDILPRPRIRGGRLKGVRAFTPSFRVSGPLSEGRAWLAQDLSYRYVRSRVYGELASDEDEVVENYNSFTQLDLEHGRHALTATAALFPLETDNWGLDSLHPVEASPEFESSGWNLALADRIRLGHETALDLALAAKRYDVRVTPRGEGRARLTPDGLAGDYIDAIDRRSDHWEFRSALSHGLDADRGMAGTHLFKAGVQASYTRFHGSDVNLPFDVLGGEGDVLWSVEHTGDGELHASDTRVALFAQDRYRPHPALALDLGVRLDYDSITGRLNPAPRAAAAYSPGADGRTLVRVGIGLFHDQLPLHAASFTDFQRRIETVYADGNPTPIIFANEVGADGLRLPRSLAFEAGIERELTYKLQLRLSYRERRTRREPIVDRMVDGAGGHLLLSSRGRARSQEFDVTIGVPLPASGQLYFSYSAARARGDLNEFTAVFGDLRDPLLLADEHGLLPFDVPHRLLAWGVVKLPARIDVGVGVEWRSGFPYTRYADDYSVVGERNGGGRFPSFLSADLKVTKAFNVFGKTTRIGVRADNVTDHFNPRDIINNEGSTDFGHLTNSRGLTLGMTLGVSWN